MAEERARGAERPTSDEAAREGGTCGSVGAKSERDGSCCFLFAGTATRYTIAGGQGADVTEIILTGPGRISIGYRAHYKMAYKTGT